MILPDAEISNMESSYIIERARAMGVHVQSDSGIHRYFLIAVSWSDQTQVSVYRKWKHITKFQRDLIRSLKESKEHNESRRYLRRTAERVRYVAQSNTMGKLKMIDSLNQYLSAITYYEEVAQSAIVLQFFKLNELDLDANLWRTGKTYLYMPRDILSDRHASLSWASTASIDGSVRTDSCDSIGNDTQDSGSDSDDVAEQLIRFVAIANFDGNEHCAISIQEFEVVQVIEMNASGWWLVRKGNENCAQNQTRCGYVPAAYLSKCMSRSDSMERSSDEEESPTVFTAGVITGANQESDIESHFSGLSTSDRSDDGSCGSGSDSSGSSSPSSETRSLDEAIERRWLESNSTVSMRKFWSSPDGNWTAYSYDSRMKGTSFKKAVKTDHDRVSCQCSRSIALSSSDNNLLRRSSIQNIAIRKRGENYIGKQSFKAGSTEELSFQEGSIVKVLRRNTDGWWLASYHGKTGLVPGVHLRRYDDPMKRMSLHMTVI